MDRFEHTSVDEVITALSEGDFNYACISTGAEFVESTLDPDQQVDLSELSRSIAAISPAFGDGVTFADGVNHAIEHAAISFHDESGNGESEGRGTPMPRCHAVGQSLKSLDIQTARKASRRVVGPPDRASYLKGVRSALQRIVEAASIEVEQEKNYHSAHIGSGRKGHATNTALLGLILRRSLRSDLLSQLESAGCAAEDALRFIDSSFDQGWIEETAESIAADDPVYRITTKGRNDLIGRLTLSSSE